MLPTQAVILCGGLGTRLGQLTAQTPKPLLPVNGVPFLEILIREVSRSGIRSFLLLAGHFANRIEEFAADLEKRLGDGFSIRVLIESKPAGTGGALFEARGALDEEFVLLNGDSFFDLPLHVLGRCLRADDSLVGAVALRRVPDVSRFGQVFLEGRLIASFVEKAQLGGEGLINAGVYLLRRDLIMQSVTPNSSLERDVLPNLASQARLGGVVSDNFFIDIGLPESYSEAGETLMAHRTRPAVFLDRDGVLNRDLAHVGTIDRFQWIEGAIEAVRMFNEAGFYVFVVTNQAGIAKGKYSLNDYWRLRDKMRSDLFANGAQIDDERFCPFHPEAELPEWRRACDWRKPAPGMILDVLANWPVRLESSFLIGDQPSDQLAADSAAIRSFLFPGGNLLEFARGIVGCN